jgi:murein DD-endopeptidase MepM/ murein hydrolase activator NlpD
MHRSNVPSRSRVWLRVAVPALLGIAAAGCSNSARFDSNPFASDRMAVQQDTTGSIATRPVSRIDAQPLPAPSRPATGYSAGSQGLGAYRPTAPEYTGTVAAHRAPPASPVGHWTWDGGSPVTVARGDTIESVARKYGVPAFAIRETNGFREGAVLRTGQRVVIPRYVTTTIAHASAPQARVKPRIAESEHVVAPGESLTGIAHKHGVTLVALAHANNIQPYAKVSIGERLKIPGEQRVAERRSTAPQVAQPRTIPATKVASAPVESARIATPETHAGAEVATKSAEAVGTLPSFRWPVKGRIIAAFGPRPNGGQNDGINLAVPEGTPIKAADDGVVAYAGNELKGYGNLVLIRHANGFVSAYANASELLVKRGDTIKRGQVIAHAGQTGNVTSPQLHFEIRKGSTPVDPTKYLGGA